MIWYILGGIVLLIVILLLCPVKILADYVDGEITAEFKYIFIHGKLYPAPEKSKKEKKPKKQPEQMTPEEEKPKQGKLDMFKVLEAINDLLPDILGTISRVFGKITIFRFELMYIVAQEEACDTAIKYGRVNAVIYSIYAFLQPKIIIKQWHCDIRQDYLSCTEKAQAHIGISMRPATAIGGGLALLFKCGGKILTLMGGVRKKGGKKTVTKSKTVKEPQKQQSR